MFFEKYYYFWIKLLSAMKLHETLKQVRKDRTSLSQGEAAKAIGISQTYLSQVEAGQKVPSKEVMDKMCEAYKTPLAIVVWMATEPKDVSPGKKAMFKLLKSHVDDLITEFFPPK